MNDVARVAGVSRKTVSRVINAEANVSNGTKTRVLQAVRELSYIPNFMAQGLATGHSRCIGVVIGHSAEFAFSNPLLGEVLKGIGQTIASRGFQVILVTQNIPGMVEPLVRNQQVDGLLLMSVPLNDPVITALQGEGFPLQLTCKYTDTDIAFVDVDNRKGALQATQHLISLGHERIGFIDGPLQHGSCRDRLAGYREALETADLAYEPTLVEEGDFSEESGFRKAFALLERGDNLTAIFAASDLMAIGAMRAVQETGLRIPEDISVVGFDGIPLSRYLSPPLTTIRQPAVEKGKLAAEMLLQRLGGERVRNHQIYLEPELVVRATTARVRQGAPV